MRHGKTHNNLVRDDTQEKKWFAALAAYEAQKRAGVKS